MQKNRDSTERHVVVSRREVGREGRALVQDRNALFASHRVRSLAEHYEGVDRPHQFIEVVAQSAFLASQNRTVGCIHLCNDGDQG